MKLKYTITILCLCAGVILSPDVYAQKKLLRGVTADLPQDKQTQDVIKNLNDRAKRGTVKFYQFDKEALKGSEIEIEIPDGTSHVFEVDEVDSRSPEDFTWHGHLAGKKGGYAVIVFLNGEIGGQVVVGSKKYSISPLSSGVISAYELDESKLPPDHPNFEDGLVPSGNEDDGSTYDNVTCRVRVLVAYTNQAQSGAAGIGYSNMQLFVQQAIAETNQGYINSAISHRVELAVALNVSYTESGNYSTDLSRFQGTADGYMDNVHTYRTLYGADLCVLLFNNSALCGIAYTINATAAEAFCLVHYSCVLGNYSFGHEMGHLYGARHNPEADPTNTPYAYGHGKCYTPGNWRTIMSYSCSGETRINYWSNPNVFYGGVATGDAAVRDNARVLNERDAVVAAFVATPVTLTLTSAGNIGQSDIGDALATTQVVLSPGFVAANGSIFRAYVGTCTGGGFKMGQDDNNYASAADAVTAENLNVYPNPSNGPLYLELKYGAQKHVIVSVLDILGKEIYREDLGSISETRVPLNMQNQAEGIYLLKVEADQEVQTRQILLRK